jgi:hypothetical protein
VPLFVCDAGYAPVPLPLGLAEPRAAILVRRRSDRCSYADPTGQPRAGRPRRATGPTRRLAGTARGARETRPVVRGTPVLGEVGRRPRATRLPKRLWRAYVHRFDVAHTLRVAKQTLLWATPRARHPEQADRWAWLVVIAYTLVRLAKPPARDRRLPWERPRPPHRLPPYRVRRAVSALLPSLGTPATPPKPCGRSPRRPQGRRAGPAPRHPAIKKAACHALMPHASSPC